MSAPLHVLGPLRHRCMGCGGCCHGVIVWLKPDEQDRLRAQAEALGRPDPVAERKIAFSGGRCPFQEDDDRCLVHRRFGLTEKPLLCQQYPLVLSRCEEGVRAAVDPGCYQGWQSWRDGPDLVARAAAVEPRPLGAAARRREEQVLDLLALPDLGLARFLSILAAEPIPACADLPPRFTHGLLAAAVGARFSRGLSPERSGARLAAVLTPVLRHAEGLDPSAPPPRPALAAAQEDFALDVVQRMVFLRIIPDIGPAVTAAIGAAGALLCGWYDPAPPAFGPAMAAWARAMRSPAVLQILAPELSALLPPVVER